MRNQAVIMIIFLLGLFQYECERYAPRAEGGYETIIVFSDSLDWVAFETDLQNVFEREILTPQNEKIFNLEWRNPLQFGIYKNWKNILFFATLESPGLGGKFVKDMLTEQVKEGVKTGDYYIFTRNNEWALNQKVMILVANDDETLRNRIKDHRTEIFNIFNKSVRERLTKWVYQSNEMKDLEKELFEKYGWTLRIPDNYFIAKEIEDENFVWLRRWNPDRFIFVHWLPAQDETELTTEWMLEKRNQLGYAHCDSMQVDDTNIKSYMVQLDRWQAVCINGLWKIEYKILGGPFWCYGFYDRTTKRVYIVDIAVFAPGEEKIPFLRQLETMVYTFSTEPFEYF